MKNWAKKNYKIILIVLGFILIGPIIINYLYKLHVSVDFFVAEWDAAAMLSYYGTIVAAVIAIFGIFVTIRYSQKSYKEDVRNRSMPFIVIDILKASSYRNFFNFLKSEDIETKPKQTEGYREYKLTDYYCILENGKIEYKTELTKTQQELLNNGGISIVHCENSNILQNKDYVCIPIEIENVGNGTAIRMRYGINSKETSVSDRKCFPVISLKQGTQMMLRVFSEDCSKNSANLGQYVLSFCYEDIYSNKYEQYFDINIEYDENNRPKLSVDMSHVQKFLGGTN